MDWREREKIENAEKINDAYIDDEGVYRWTSSKRVPFNDMLECWNLSDETMQKCIEARSKDDSEFAASYRKRMENYEPSAEEMYEMRSAFGEGETVVNVITGKTIKL